MYELNVTWHIVSTDIYFKNAVYYRKKRLLNLVKTIYQNLFSEILPSSLHESH